MPGTAHASVRRDYLWNTAASIMSSLSSVLLLVVVTRTAGLAAGGLFSLAFAVGQQFQTVGMYEVKSYHVTDVRRVFPFGTYLATRILTVAAMVLCIIGYAILTSSTATAAATITLVAALRCFDAFEDVFCSEFQRSGVLYVGARATFWRLVATTVSFSIMLLVTSSLLTAAAVASACSLAALIVLNIPATRGLYDLRPMWQRAGIHRVLSACLPLFLASFIALYLANAPRFAIDRFLDNSQQGYFAILIMPAFVINLLSTMVFRPLLTTMAEWWNSGDVHSFLKVITRAVTISLIATLGVAVLTYLIGPELLYVVYGKSVDDFLPELMILVAGGGANACSVILYYALITMRRQRLVFVGYLIAAATITIMCAALVPSAGLRGACLSYTAAMTILAVFFGIIARVHRADR